MFALSKSAWLDIAFELVASAVPRPCVGEGLGLGAVFGADVVVYLVVVTFGIERRIDITKINRLVTDKLPHHIKIVAVIEFVHGICRVNVALSKYQGKTLILLVLFGIKVFECVRELVEFHLAFVGAEQAIL